MAFQQHLYQGPGGVFHQTNTININVHLSLLPHPHPYPQQQQQQYQQQQPYHHYQQQLDHHHQQYEQQQRSQQQPADPWLGFGVQLQDMDSSHLLTRGVHVGSYTPQNSSRQVTVVCEYESLNFRFVKQDAERVVLDPLRHPSHDWALGLLTLPQGEGQALRLRQSWTGLAKSRSCALECIPYAAAPGSGVDTSVSWYARRARGCCSHLQALAAYQHDCRAQDHQRNLSPQQWEQVFAHWKSRYPTPFVTDEDLRKVQAALNAHPPRAVCLQALPPAQPSSRAPYYL